MFQVTLSSLSNANYTIYYKGNVPFVVVKWKYQIQLLRV
jgi:hypothetical protein